MDYLTHAYVSSLGSCGTTFVSKSLLWTRPRDKFVFNGDGDTLAHALDATRVQSWFQFLAIATMTQLRIIDDAIPASPEPTTTTPWDLTMGQARVMDDIQEIPMCANNVALSRDKDIKAREVIVPDSKHIPRVVLDLYSLLQHKLQGANNWDSSKRWDPGMRSTSLCICSKIALSTPPLTECHSQIVVVSGSHVMRAARWCLKSRSKGSLTKPELQSTSPRMCSRCASSTPPLPTMHNSQTVVRLGTHEREATFSCLSISRKTVQLALAHTLCLPPSTDLPKSLPVQSRSTVTRSSPVQFVGPNHSLLSISHPTAKTVSCSSCFSILRYAPFCFFLPCHSDRAR